MSVTFLPPGAPWRLRHFLVPFVLIGLSLMTAAPARAQAPPGPTTRIAAPELDGVGWLGTDKPIRLKDLRGKIVILDFWTLC